MGYWTTLTASDGVTVSAYVAGDVAAERGLVVIQEGFGVNNHIRNVCGRYAKEGLLAISPALFDRIGKNIEIDYDEVGVAKAIETVSKLSMDEALKDIKAALDYLGSRKKSVIGFCLGGTLAWLCASRLDEIDAAVGFYGGRIAANKDIDLKRPIQLHFGADDPNIPLTDVAAISSAHPEIEVFSYDGAGHGFCCDERSNYHQPSAELAKDRALKFLSANMGN